MAMIWSRYPRDADITPVSLVRSSDNKPEEPGSAETPPAIRWKQEREEETRETELDEEVVRMSTQHQSAPVFLVSGSSHIVLPCIQSVFIDL